MSNDLSKLDPIKLDPGKASWLECHATGKVKNANEPMHGFGIPELMPATIIFVMA
jgi:hypothetical protein